MVTLTSGAIMHLSSVRSSGDLGFSVLVILAAFEVFGLGPPSGFM